MLAALPLESWKYFKASAEIYAIYIYIYIYFYREREIAIIAAVPLNSGGNAAAATPLHPCMDYVAELSRKYPVRKQRKTTHADTSKKCKLLGWPKIEKKVDLGYVGGYTWLCK